MHITKIILIRHGQTIWNHEKKYQGHSDVELTTEGLEQARKVAERLAAEKIDAVYSSDLSRAFRTAGYIAVKHNLEVKIAPKLREVMFGEWEGLTFSEINKKWPGHFEKLLLFPDETKVPGGESFQEVKERAYEALQEIVAAHAGGTAAVVSHGGTIGAVFCAVLNISLKHVWSIRQDNTAVNIIEFHQNKPVITLLNDVHHLQLV